MRAPPQPPRAHRRVARLRALLVWLAPLLLLFLGPLALSYLAPPPVAPTTVEQSWSPSSSSESRDEAVDLETNEEREDSAPTFVHSLSLSPWHEPVLSHAPRARRRRARAMPPPRVDLEPGTKPPARIASLGQA